MLDFHWEGKDMVRLAGEGEVPGLQKFHCTERNNKMVKHLLTIKKWLNKIQHK